MPHALTIGWLSRNAGIGIETIRFYEKQGLVFPESRTTSGYRLYEEVTVTRIQFIRRARALGFSLREIRELLSLQTDMNATRAEVRECIKDKLGDVHKKIADLQDIQISLEALLRSCDKEGPVEGCPILAAFVNQDEAP